MKYFAIFLSLVALFMIALNPVSAQCAYDPNQPHKPCDDTFDTLIIEPHEAKIENIDGQLFHVIGPFVLEQESNDRIRLDGVTFTYPSFPNPPMPGGPVSVTITFENGSKENIFKVGAPLPFIEFVGVDPQAGVRRNIDGTFNFLLSIDQQSISPLKQFKSGITIDEIQCKESLSLVTKHNGSPACVQEQIIPKLIDRGWAAEYIQELEIPVSPPGVDYLLDQAGINYLPDKLVVAGGLSIRGDSGCGAVIDTDSQTHWFGIDSISEPKKITFFQETPQMCKVNTAGCYCDIHRELTALTLDELSYFTLQEEEKYAEILIDYLGKENINRTPKFQLGKFNLNYTDSFAMGYCGELWGTNTYDFFEGAFVKDIVKDYGIDKELSPLCAISDDARWWERK